MPIALTCECGKKLKANPENAGMKGRCPDCGKIFVIPKPELGEDGEAHMRRVCADAAALRRDSKGPEDLDRAAAAFRQAVEEFGHYWASHYGLANTLLMQFRQNKDEPDYKLRSDGLSALKKAVTLGAGKQREPLLELARYTCPIDIKEGSRLYRKALRACDADQEPLFPVTWQSAHHFKLAVAAAEAGLNALSIEAFCRAIALDGSQFQTPPTVGPKAAVCYALALKKMEQGGPDCTDHNQVDHKQLEEEA